MYINAGLIGFPLSHSLSPTLHSYFFNVSGLNGGYCCFEVPNTYEIPNTIDIFKKFSFVGFNVTVPYKTEIIKYCDEIYGDALNVGAVNTVHIKNGSLIGYNTDVFGFSKLLESANISLAGKKVVLLGAGGAAKAVITYLNKNCPNILTIANRTVEKGKKLASFCQFETEVLKGFDSLKGCQYDIIINSTSLGLGSEQFPDLGIKQAEAAVDLQYKTSVTPFLANVDAVTKIDGFPMLVWQGSKAFEIWTGHKIQPDMDLLIKNIF